MIQQFSNFNFIQVGRANDIINYISINWVMDQSQSSHHLQNCQKINLGLLKKYGEKFYFYEATPIYEIIYNEANSEASINFKEMEIYKEASQFLKKYYFLVGKQQAIDRIQFLTKIHSKDKQISLEYHTMIIANMEQIMNQRVKRKAKIINSNNTQHQINQNTAIFGKGCNLNFFQDYDQVSISNKTEYIRGIQSKCVKQEEQLLNVSSHDIYQSQIITQPNIGQFDWRQVNLESSLNHLITCFNDQDEDKIIEQYQVIQLKRRKRAQEKANIISKNNLNKQLKKQFFHQPVNKTQNIISQHSNIIKNNYPYLLSKKQINITGTKHKKGTLSKLNNCNIKSNPLLKSNPQNYKFYAFNARRNKSRDNNSQISNQYQDVNNNLNNHQQQISCWNLQSPKDQIKRYCLNLNTKQVYEKNNETNLTFHHRTKTQTNAKIQKKNKTYKPQSRQQTKVYQNQILQQNNYQIKRPIFFKPESKQSDNLITKIRNRNEEYDSLIYLSQTNSTTLTPLISQHNILSSYQLYNKNKQKNDFLSYKRQGYYCNSKNYNVLSPKEQLYIDNKNYYKDNEIGVGKIKQKYFFIK